MHEFVSLTLQGRSFSPLHYTSGPHHYSIRNELGRLSLCKFLWTSVHTQKQPATLHLIFPFTSKRCFFLLFTPHKQRERGICDRDWSPFIYICIYVCVCVCVYDPKKFEWHFSGRLTFSNTRSRLLLEFIDYSTTVRSRKAFLVE